MLVARVSFGRPDRAIDVYSALLHSPIVFLVPPLFSAKICGGLGAVFAHTRLMPFIPHYFHIPEIG